MNAATDHDIDMYLNLMRACSGYYKCSTVRGCPARKHVERDPGEPAMLIVTYEGDHRHDDQQDRTAGGAPQTEHTTTSS